MKVNKMNTTTKLPKKSDVYKTDSGKFAETGKRPNPVRETKIIIATVGTDGHIHPSTTPYEYKTPDSALGAAKTMAAKHKKPFVVLTELARIEPPAKVEPTVIVNAAYSSSMKPSFKDDLDPRHVVILRRPMTRNFFYDLKKTSGKNNKWFGVPELQRILSDLGYSSNVHDVLTTLNKAGFVEKRNGSSYYVGYRLTDMRSQKASHYATAFNYA